ncbi:MULTISPECIES: transporter substrate-binding domain-containing protein [unclassified Pseudoalteromonas]|uniref:substrate-binding periplasmic protein n=1 Tax=unclassified Pseudoalteromonas TaxID=194690 RepID=UPI0025B36A9C|nr:MULTISPECIES: transporter substrate-binding domain-containing protein [unclassified Pseudoalteromonas]MDN3379029.1 transporter substrate-binding domain-containing protein [Pseudoalteromonas sp. APC 3893]MDN3387728.1 transporter substrate-binding domain-containing protein [Pseudoalteromonas sp. APC 4017]
MFCKSLLAGESVTLKYNLTGSGNYFPYYTGDSDLPGIFPEIVQQILNTANIQGEHVVLPAKRTVKSLITGKIDFDIISTAWLSKQERDNPLFVYSEPLFQMSEYLVSLPKHAKKWQSLAAINGNNVGTVMGYYYYDDDEFSRMDFPSEKELILALQRQRLEVVIISELSALFWSRELGVQVALGAAHSDGFLRIRILHKYHHLLPQINQAIKQLHQEGTISSIEQKYIDIINKIPTL